MSTEPNDRENSPVAPSEAETMIEASADNDIPVEVEAPPLDPISELQAKLAAAELAKKENWDKYLRAVADLENGRRRAKRDIDDAKFDSRNRVLKEMLPVVDNLERAVEHSGSAEGDAKAVLEGVKLVLRQFQQAFERLEVTPIEAIGQAFDPNLHEAISQQESSDFDAGTVMQVLQRGYRHGDRLLRPSMVVVARAKAETDADSTQGEPAKDEPKS